MKRLIMMVLLTVIIGLPAHAAYTGRVFIDKNKNGTLDRDEKPLEGVMVSDGLHVVRTDANGNFRLPGHDRERFVFITTPSGYMTDNKHYIPIDKERNVYNFGLQPQEGRVERDGSHRFLHISDTEIFNTDRHEDWLKDLRSYARGEKAAFIIHTGDICYEKGLREHIELMNTRNMNCPVFYCIGNHDLTSGERAEGLFEELYGPVYYSFEVGNVHYVVTPMLTGDHAPSYTKDDVYQWLRNDLRQVPLGKPVVVFNHDLLTERESFQYGISDTETVDLNRHNLKAWIYGHRHSNYVRRQGDVLTICTNSLDKGGIDHSTAAFRVVDIDRRGNISSQLRYTYINKHIEIAAPGRDGFPVFASGAVPVTVNTYHSTSPTREVTYTCTVGRRRIVSDRKLTQRTDWTWKDILYLSRQDAGKAVTLKVTATFANGEKAEKSVSFTCGNRKPLTNLTEPWQNLLGDAAHTGANIASVDSALRMAWTNNVGANVFMTSPVVYKGKVFVGSTDENLKGQSFVYALDGQSGDILWKFSVQNSIKNSIAVAEDLVFAQTVQGSIYAINISDGSLKWGKQATIDGRTAMTEGLVVADGVLYAGTGNGLCALNTQTGDRVWQSKEWQQREGSTATLTLGKDMLIGSVQWRGLYGNDARDGALKWELTRSGIRHRASSATINGNQLYILSDSALFIIDPLTGEIIVRKPYPFSVNVTSTPLLTDTEIIFGTAKQGLVAVDRETLDLKWECPTGDALVYTTPYTRQPSATVETSPVLGGNTVYFAASDGNLYGVDRSTGEVVWQYTSGAPFFGSVAVSGNTLLAVDFGGNVYAFVTQ